MLIKEFHNLPTIHISNFKSILNCFKRYEEFKYKCNFLIYVIYYIHLTINGNLLSFTQKFKRSL